MGPYVRIGASIFLSREVDTIAFLQFASKGIVIFAQVALTDVESESHIRVGISFTRGDIRDAVTFLFRVHEQEAIPLFFGGQRFYIRRFRVVFDDHDGFRLTNDGCFERSFLLLFGCSSSSSSQGIKAVILDKFDQFGSIERVGRISALFEATCPSFVILYGYLETGGITGTFEEERVVFERLGRISVLTETFSFAVIIIVIDASEPIAGTLDTEVIACVTGQFTLSSSGLEERLRHNDGSRYAVILLISYRGFFPYLDIREISRILPLR